MTAATESADVGAIEVLDELLYGLRETLQAGVALRIEPCLPLLLALRDAANVPGVVELLRLWCIGLEQRQRDAADDLADGEVASMIDWFARLRRYLDGSLPAEEQRELVPLPDDIAGLQRLSTVWSDELLRRLAQSAPAAIGKTVAADDAPADAFDAFTAFDAGNAPVFGATTVIAPVEDAAPAFIGDAHVDAGDASASDHAVIWLNAEEAALTRKAVEEDLVPLLSRWAVANDEEERAAALVDIGYQGELVCGVLEVMGTERLAHGLRAAFAYIQHDTTDEDAERMLETCMAMLAVLDQPGEESALLLAPLVDWIPELDETWLAALVAELDSVRFGTDPAQLAAIKREVGEEDASLQIAADTLPAVLEGMLRELPGNTERLGASVRGVVAHWDAQLLNEARRVSHTLKGDANTVGIRGLAGIAHALEDIFDAYAKFDGQPDPQLAELLVDATDKIEEISDYLLGRGPHPDGVQALYQQLLDTANAIVELEGDALPARMSHEPVPLPAMHVAPAEPELPAQAAEPVADVAPQAAGNSPSRSLTLGSEVLDHLQNLVGEATIAAQGIDRLLENVVNLRRDQEAAARQSQDLLARLDDLVALRGAALQSSAMREGVDVDPLELDQYNELHVISRQLAEAQADSAESLRTLRRTLSALEDLRSEQETVNRELQRSILRTRMVPFAQVSARLQRIVRQTAKSVGKQVELDLAGEETLIDAELLERVVEPLGHLIRNAIDHGLEAPEQRERVGKPALSTLRIGVGVQGDQAIIDVRDDGQGFDYDAIRARAVQMGLLDADEAIDERRLDRIVLLPGFSTRDSATEISGRGVGMDVVNQRVLELRGSLQLDSEAGKGLQVKLRLPVTQTLANVVMVGGEQARTAVVASAVEQIVGFGAEAVSFDAASQSLVVSLDGKPVRALPMEALYGEGGNAGAWLSSGGLGLLTRDARNEACLVLVRSVEDVRSVVVKPVSTALPPIPAVRGITQLPDGGLAPVVDIDQLLVLQADQGFAARSLSVAPSVQAPRIVVADDSLSARRALEQLMRDAGYTVDVASDGFEAIAQVEARPTSVLLVDMEMPRMNGLEVARNLRTKAATRDLPIFMITSRTADKHHQMAEDAGVTHMLSKPVSEDVLATLVAAAIANRIAVDA